MNNHLFAFCFAAFCLMPVSGIAQNIGIWGREITPEMFDKTPLREIRIPEWLEDTTRIVYTLTQSENYEEAARAGAQVGEMSFVDTGWVNYKSKFLQKINPHLKPGQLEKQIQGYKRAGIRILASFGPMQQGEMYEKHPDWRAIRQNTTNIPQVDLTKQPSGGQLCLMGPWGDMLIEILAEILTLYPDVDAFGFDGIHHNNICYCQHCRVAYRKDTDREIPDMDLASVEYRRYLVWVNRRMESVIQRMQRRIKGIKKDAAIITWTTNAGRYGHFLTVPENMPARMNLLFDGPDQEFWMDELNRGNTIVPAFGNAYLWSVSNHRVAFSTPYMMSHGNPYGTDSFPRSEMFRRAMMILTWGARPSPAPAFAGFNKAGLETTSEIKRRSRWLTHKTSERWGALVMSDRTRNFYGREASKVEERYLANVFGFFRAVLEEHLPFEIINDWNLNSEDLARYKVVILANTACLDSNQVSAIRQFVENGGGVVATADTSLFDELGNARKNFALADLFGADWRGLPRGDAKQEDLDVNFLSALNADYWSKRKNVFEAKITQHAIFRETRLSEYLGGRPVLFKGQALIAEKTTGEVIGTIAPRGQEQTSYPAMIRNPFGSGKVVYFPASFDAAYYLYSYPYQRILLTQAIRSVAPNDFRIKVDAPMCVHATQFRQRKDGERLVIHLFNGINSTGGHAFPNDDVPLPEEIVPVHNIKVRFEDYSINRVHLEPEGTELPMRKLGAAVEITVPALQVHSMVVAELAKDSAIIPNL